MTIHEKSRRRVIELIHGLPYDEAIKIEGASFDCRVKNYFDEDSGRMYKHTPGLPITLERVLQALKNKMLGKYIFGHYKEKIDELFKCWVLVREDRFTPADHRSQSKETLKKLLEILK